MADLTFAEIVQAAQKLTPAQKSALIHTLQADSENTGLTREELIREVEILRNTPVRPGDRLLGKYANPNVPEMSEETFHAQMHAIATEWEQELDEFYSDDDDE